MLLRFLTIVRNVKGLWHFCQKFWYGEKNPIIPIISYKKIKLEIRQLQKQYPFL